MVILLASAACAGPAPAVTAEEYQAAEARLRPALTEVEMDDFIEACLEDQAVTVFTRLPGGQGFIGENVSPRDSQVMEDCKDQLLATFEFPPPPESAADFRVLYDRYLVQAECLRSLGVTVDVPSFDTYYDQRGDWFPYQNLEPVDGEQWQLWNDTCPQSPWEYEPATRPGQ